MPRQNITGIHVYCDRWCERCMFTSRCAVYEMESGAGPEERDITNQVFWERLGENFAKAQELLQKAADQHGIDLDTIGLSAEEEEQRQSLRDGARKDPLALLSLEYSKIGRDWLKTQPGMLDHLETLKAGLEMGVESESDALKQTTTIRDSIAVIQWYLVFIHIKLTRALTGKATAKEWDDDDDFPRDYDGSAKIAIIGIDRSISAWAALFELLPEHEDHFLKVLSMLQKIRSLTMESFPDAMAFVRPGFDTATPSSMAS